MAISGANEVYKKVSPLVEQQFPEYIRENGPRFVAFMEAYYEYMEQTGKAGHAIRTLNDNQDIDRTVVDFVEYFRREFALSIPKSALADKRLIVKHIREFYRSRGSQKSFKFLFHILFGTEVDFYYPGEDILRTSDGRWIRETVLTVEKQSGDINLLDGRTITGQTSGAIGRVQNTIVIINLGIEVFKLTIENVTGAFIDKEIVTDGFGNSVRVKADIGGIVTQTILDGGVFNIAGDSLELVGETSGSFAEGIVSKIENSTALTFTISKGGSGYRTGINSVFDIESSGPASLTPSLSVVSLSNTSLITIFTDTINGVKNVVLNGNLPTSNIGVTFSALGSNSTTLSANLASANIYSVIGAKLKQGSVLVGSINAISILSPGKNYTSIPKITIIDQDVASQGIVGQNGKFKGQDAVIVPNFAPGAIKEIEVTTSGEDADFILGETVNIRNTRTNVSDTITVDDSTIGIPRHILTTVRNGTSSVLSITGIQKLTGRYLGTKGFLSWNNKIQDNYYYQEFSYVLKSPNLVDAYRDVVQNVLHAAGTKMFGSYEIVSKINVSITLDEVISKIIYESAYLPILLEDAQGYLRIENPISVFLVEDDSGDILIGENLDNIIEEQFDTNFAAYIQQEDPGAYVRDGGVEIIASTRDSYGVISNYLLSITETAGTVSDLLSAIITKEVNITESGVTPVDIGSAVYIGPAAVTESGVTPADREIAVYTGPAAVTESGVTPADREIAVYTGPAAVTESGVTPADREIAVYTGPAAVTESGVTPADREIAVIFKLATTTGQSTGFVRVVYGNTQISTFSKDTVNVFKSVQIQTMTDLDGIPRLVLVTPPDIGRNLDRQANGNFGNGTIISSTTVKIIPVGGSNTTQYTVATIYSNNFLTLSSDYIPTTANAQLYWGS